MLQPGRVEELAVSAELIGDVETGALLHDIGKIGIPDAVLFKPGPLDPDERRLIVNHPAIGAEMLGRGRSVERVVPCVLHHHERIDGSGYPHGLEGEAIPLGARIIAVADAFDAMTTDRPYRRGMRTDAAVAELVAGRGTQFDADCFSAFTRLIVGCRIVPVRARGRLKVAFGTAGVAESGRREDVVEGEHLPDHPLLAGIA